MRIGLGYDVHCLVKGRDLILGGVKIEYERGLLGHSDADVLTHAIIDAILGAMNKGDIGCLFPDSDPQYKNISSMILLERVKELMEGEKYEILNIDSIVVAQNPRLAPYRARIAENLAQVLNISPEQVSVKATTEEKLGFTGDGSGISAKAVVLINNRGRVYENI